MVLPRRHMLAMSAVVIALSGCASTRPYVYSGLKTPITVRDSEFHRVTYVRAYERGGELVVYGKLEHDHGYCSTEGHVDLAITDGQGRGIQAASLPLRAGSLKQHGWFGASFRARLRVTPPADSQLLLAVHDAGCWVGETFDCGENVAVTAARTQERSDLR